MKTQTKLKLEKIETIEKSFLFPNGIEGDELRIEIVHEPMEETFKKWSIRVTKNHIDESIYSNTTCSKKELIHLFELWVIVAYQSSTT